MDYSVDQSYKSSLLKEKFNKKFIGEELMNYWGHLGTIINLSVKYSPLKKCLNVFKMKNWYPIAGTMLHLMKTSQRKKMRMRKKFKITLSWKLMIKFSHWLRTNLHKPLNLLLSMLYYPLCQFIQKDNLAQFHLVSPFSTFFPPRPVLVGVWNCEKKIIFAYLFSLI